MITLYSELPMCYLDGKLYQALMVCRPNGFGIGCIDNDASDIAGFMFLRSDKDCRCPPEELL